MVLQTMLLLLLMVIQYVVPLSRELFVAAGTSRRIIWVDGLKAVDLCSPAQVFLIVRSGHVVWCLFLCSGAGGAPTT